MWDGLELWFGLKALKAEGHGHACMGSSMPPWSGCGVGLVMSCLVTAMPLIRSDKIRSNEIKGQSQQWAMSGAWASWDHVA